MSMYILFKTSLRYSYVQDPSTSLTVSYPEKIIATLTSPGMQNLSISCALVCLIVLGSAALVGTFGVCKHQISAVLVTGVMYLLAGMFMRNEGGLDFLVMVVCMF